MRKGILILAVLTLEALAPGGHVWSQGSSPASSAAATRSAQTVPSGQN